MGYIHILRYTASYRNDFFYPHGGLFTLVYPGSFSFYVLCCAVCCYTWLRIVSCLRVACLVVVMVWCGLVVSCSVLPGALPLLTPRGRVSGSCGHGVRWSHGLVVIILPYNTKHYYYGRTQYRRSDCLEVRYVC